jgi:rhodanese-related sulfurtransferase
MKKFLMALFSALFVLSAVGCGSGSDDKSTSKVKQGLVESGNEQVENNESKTEGSQEQQASNPGDFKDGAFGRIDFDDSKYKDLSSSEIIKDSLAVDIRTVWEREHLGYPKGFTNANNVVYEERVYSDKDHHTNPEPRSDAFVSDISNLVGGDKNKKIVLICASGSRTQRAAKLLSENGFTNVYDVDGGFGAWNGKDMPVEAAIK